MKAEQYLQEHGLSPEFVKTLGWVWDEEKITIPYYSESGKLLHCRYRHLEGDKKFDADPGSKMALYASHKIKNEQVVVLCEGEPDCAKLWQEGIPAVTAGGVSSLTAKIAESLKGKDVIVLMDNDKPGQGAIETFCTMLLQAEATPRVASLPEGVKDVCDLFAQGGVKEQIIKSISASISYEDWREASRPKEHKILSGEEILQREIPKQKWLISRMVPIEGITLLVGSEGVGKSFYTLTMADAITTGEKWLDAFKVKQKEKCLFLDKENTIGGIQERMKYMGMSGKGMFFLEYPEHFALEGDQDGFSEFAIYVKEFVEKNSIGLIVIDSLVDFMTGNENSSGDTQIFFNAIKLLFPSRSIIIIHHAGKPTQGVMRTSSQKSRGSTNITAQAFSAFFIEPMPRSKNEYSIEHTKLRGAQKTNKFKVEMEIHQDLYDKEETHVVGLRYKGEIEDEELKSVLAEELIMDTLNNKDEVSLEDMVAVCEAQGVSTKTIRNALKKLKDDNAIESLPNPNNRSKRILVLK